MPVPERGIALTTGELACEGVDTVLDAIAETGATAVMLPTGMVIEGSPDDGVREPPDAEGQNCLLDRPLWDKRSLYVRNVSVHDADPDLWRDLPWPPPAVTPDDIRVDYPRLAIDGARERNLRVYAQLTPYALPEQESGQNRDSAAADIRDAFRPRRLTGGPSPRTATHIGCINHPEVRALGRARVRELLRHYGDVDGLSIDWPEFPVSFVEEMFTCFCDHCHAAAESHGHDWELICHGVRGLWDSYHTLTPERVRAVTESGDWGDLLTDPASVQAGINAWLDYKAHTVVLVLREIRDAMRDSGAGNLLLSANGFPMPWAGATGADYRVVGHVVDSMRPKLYSFHWHMMIRWWTESLLLWNKESRITPEEMTGAVLALFDIKPAGIGDSPVPEMFGMPGPDDHHGLTPGSYTDRLENALAQRDETSPPYIPIIHGYRSVDDFAELLETIRPFAGEGLWVQRYGYLRDEKLALLKQEWGTG